MAWTVLKRCVLFLLALTGLAPALAAEPAAPAPSAAAAPRGPALWLIEDGDTRIYLFGTVHVFPASLQWRTPALDRAIGEAGELVLETPDAAEDDPRGSERLLAPMRLGKSVPILQRVSPRARPALQAVIEASGLPMEVYDGLATWGVGFLLTSFQIGQATGPDGAPVPMSGAEEVLSQLFRKSRRPIHGVETVEDQLRVFSTMGLGAQQRFLESSVGILPEGSAPPVPVAEDAQAGGLADRAWVRGDVEAIGREMNDMPRELYEPLLIRRNANWTQWLQRRLERPGTVLFAVGAGHLAGPDSVLAMLAARGIHARRIN